MKAGTGSQTGGRCWEGDRGFRFSKNQKKEERAKAKAQEGLGDLLQAVFGGGGGPEGLPGHGMLQHLDDLPGASPLSDPLRHMVQCDGDQGIGVWEVRPILLEDLF